MNDVQAEIIKKNEVEYVPSWKKQSNLIRAYRKEEV